MLNNFIYSDTKNVFVENLNNGEVLDEAIAFIGDTKEIWNRGQYFGSTKDIKEDIARIESEMSKINLLSTIQNTSTWNTDLVEGDYTSYTYWVAPLGKVQKGETYTFFCENSEQTAGSDTGYKIVIDDGGSTSLSLFYTVSFGKEKRATLTINADSNSGRFVVYKNTQTTTPKARFQNISLVKGNVPLINWRPNFNDMTRDVAKLNDIIVKGTSNTYLPYGNVGIGFTPNETLSCKLSVNGSIVAKNTTYFSAASASTNNVIKCSDHNSQNLVVIHNTNGITVFNTDGTGKSNISRSGKGTFNGGLEVQMESNFNGDIIASTSGENNRQISVKNDQGQCSLDVSIYRGVLDNTGSKWMICAGPNGGTSSGTDYGHMWINAATSGNTGIGFNRGNPISYKLHVNGTVGATAFYETSDARLKNFSDDVKVDFDKLKNIPKVHFTWKEGNDKNIHIGTSAQKVQELYPELVYTAEDGILSVDYAKLSIVALAAVDKLYEENQRLKKQMSDFETRLNELENGNRN